MTQHKTPAEGDLPHKKLSKMEEMNIQESDDFSGFVSNFDVVYNV